MTSELGSDQAVRAPAPDPVPQIHSVGKCPGPPVERPKGVMPGIGTCIPLNEELQPKSLSPLYYRLMG